MLKTTRFYEADNSDAVFEQLLSSRYRVVQEINELKDALRAFEAVVREKEKSLKHLDHLLEDYKKNRASVKALITPPPKNLFINVPIIDAAYNILLNLERPMHVKELLEVMEDGGKPIRSKRPDVSIAAALSKDPRFVRVAPNTFDLSIKEKERIVEIDADLSDDLSKQDVTKQTQQ